MSAAISPSETDKWEGDTHMEDPNLWTTFQRRQFGVRHEIRYMPTLSSKPPPPSCKSGASHDATLVMVGEGIKSFDDL